MAGNVLKGDYFYNQILPLIDYSGDIRGGRTNYSPDFSPNNIRTLIISPERVIVRYHIAVKGRKTQGINLNPQFVARCTMLEDYKPAMSVLYADRICASIEEIVVVNTNGVFSSSELDFNNMIKNYGKVSGDVKELIMQRYKRFRAFVVVNDCNCQQFLDGVKASEPTDCLFESQFVQEHGRVVRFNEKEDWYKGYGSAASFYLPDRDGGALNTHFKSLIEKYEAEKKNKALASMKEERVKGVREKWEHEKKTYDGVVKGTRMLEVFLTSQDSVLWNDAYFEVRPLSLSEPKSKADYEEQTKQMSQFIMQTYVYLVQNFISSVNEMTDALRFAIVTKCNGDWKKVPGCEFNKSTLSDKNLGIESCRIETSYRNLFADYVTVFVRKSDGKSVAKYCTPDGWREVI